MKAYKGFEAKKAVSGTDQLPAGGYVAKIMKAEVCEYSWGDVLVISFDIAEGDYKGHFRKRWEADKDSNFGQKWKGTFRLNVPSEKSRYPESDKRAFGNAMWAIEQSNKGYTWSWKEETLKGKAVGVLFRNREWEKDGNTGWTTECCTLLTVDDVKNGNYKPAKDKPLKQTVQTPSPAAQAAETASTIDDDELPF